MAGYPDEKGSDNPLNDFVRDLASAAADTIGTRLEVLDNQEYIGDVIWLGGSAWRFDRAERFDQEDPFEPPEREQIGLGRIQRETGTTDRMTLPGDEIVDDAIQGPDSVVPPDDIMGWELVPESERSGNYTELSYKAGTRPLFVRVTAPIGTRGSWKVSLEDSRIGGFSSVDPNTRSSRDQREYESLGGAAEAAFRWMASHSADTANHPFWDERIAFPPSGWRLAGWSLNQTKEQWTWEVEAGREMPHGLQQIDVVGFPVGDKYSYSASVALESIDPDAIVPDRDMQVPRNRLIRDVTAFMEANTPEGTGRVPGATTLSDAERGRIRHHAVRDNFNQVLGTLGLRGPMIAGSFEGEIDTVQEFVDWYATHGDFLEFEGIGPSRNEELVAAARFTTNVLEDFEESRVTDVDVGDELRTDAGNLFTVRGVEPDGSLIVHNARTDTVSTLGRDELEMSLQSGEFELVDE